LLFSQGGIGCTSCPPSGVGQTGKVLTSDGSKKAVWATPSGGSGWSLTGNTGTNPATNFIGTTDTARLKFGVGGLNRGVIDNDDNIGFGSDLYGSLTIGTSNVALSTSALAAATSGANNIGIGQSAGQTITTGGSNILIGTSADVSDATGDNAIAIGSSAIAAPDAIALGNSATATTGQFSIPAAITDIQFPGATIMTAPLAAFDDDAAAGLAGLTTGQWYQTTGSGAAPLNVAGIVMIKQ
jgi:hypothetical protein